MLGQPTAHVGQRAGELSDCIAYCTKPESRKPGTEPVIKGQPRCLKQVKGERSDLNRAREIIQEHRTWTAVINDRSLCDVLARHPRWAHDVFENRAARPVDEATSLEAFAGWQHEVLRRMGCGGEEVSPEKKVLWFYTEDSIKMLHLHHLDAVLHFALQRKYKTRRTCPKAYMRYVEVSRIKTRYSGEVDSWGSVG